jgi:hypothetical protein
MEAVELAKAEKARAAAAADKAKAAESRRAALERVVPALLISNMLCKTYAIVYIYIYIYIILCYM